MINISKILKNKKNLKSKQVLSKINCIYYILKISLKTGLQIWFPTEKENISFKL